MNITEFKKRYADGKRDFQKIDPQWDEFSGNGFSWANFRESNLTSVNFQGANKREG